MKDNDLHTSPGSTGESPVRRYGGRDKTSSVNTLGGRTKISLGEAVVILGVLLSTAGWLRSRLDRIESKLDQSWTVQNQAEWQREYEKSGFMPNPFDVKRRSALAPHSGAIGATFGGKEGIN